jgi:hypothetical protein
MSPAEPRIFISIACFSDPDVVDTVKDALAQARHPSRLSFGICLQALPDDRSYDELAGLSQVRLDRISVSEARGPIYARSRCETLLEGEEYFLQLDCHSRFFEGWDEILIEEFQSACNMSERVVISHYPINISNMTSDEHLRVIGHVNRYRQVDAESIKSHGSLISLPERPIVSFGISAAMLFMRSEDRLRFPYDPELDFGLHAAEQVLYAIRLWTHGYDILCPTRHAVATDYAGSRDRIPDDAKRISNGNRMHWPQATWSKVKYVLGLDTLEQVDLVYRDGMSECLERFGLGDERSLLDYFRFAGIHEQLKEAFPHYRYQDE